MDSRRAERKLENKKGSRGRPTPIRRSQPSEEDHRKRRTKDTAAARSSLRRISHDHPCPQDMDRHPIYEAGVTARSTGPMGLMFRIVDMDFRELLFYDVG